MKFKEVNELVSDIDEAFLELGVLEDGKTKNPTNLIWHKNISIDNNGLYKQVEKPVYSPYKLHGLNISPAAKDELEVQGLDYIKIAKVYISSKSFIAFKIVPKQWDQVEHLGIRYDIKHIKPLNISDTTIMYVVFLAEASIIEQTKAIRKEEFPTMELIEAQDPLIVYLPAELLFENKTSYVFTATNNLMQLHSNNFKAVITIPVGTYTKSSLVLFLNSVFMASFGKEFLAFSTTTTIGIRTIMLGIEALLDVIYLDNNAYDELGIGMTRKHGSKSHTGGK